MEPFATKFTDDYEVGAHRMWEYCNYIYKCEGEWQRFLITFEVNDTYGMAEDERVKQMINAVAARGADRLNQATQTGLSASQLPGGEPRTDVFQVRSLRRLQNDRHQPVNAAIVEIDKVASDLPYPNQLGLFKIYPPEELNAQSYPHPFEKARAFPLWRGNMVLVKTYDIPANKKPDVQTWFPYPDNTFKLRDAGGIPNSDYNKNAHSSHFRIYRPET